MATLLNAVSANGAGSGASHAGPCTVFVRGTLDGATVTIEVADKSSRSGIQNALSETSMFGELKNLENEIRSIKSFPLILETVNHLDFNVSYFVEGDIKKRELYGGTPFKIELIGPYQYLLGHT